MLSGALEQADYWSHTDVVLGAGNRRPNIKVSATENTILVQGEFELDGDLIFEKDEKYNREIIFDGGTYRNIIFRGGSFKKIRFRRGSFNGFVSIRGGNIENLALLGGDFKHWLGTLDGLENTENGLPLAEEPLHIGRFEIEGGSFLTNIWISGGDIDSLEVKCVTPVKIHCKPNDDQYFATSENKYRTRFESKPRIRNLVISRYSNKDNFFHFSDLDLETIKFENFTNIGNITIAKVTLGKEICISNSDLGKTTFIDCDFSKNTFFFDSSKINEIALAGTLLPAADSIKSFKNEQDQHQRRLVLGQLKKVYSNLGNTVQAGIYQSDELEALRQILPRGTEKFNLWINHFTNRHGLNWWRALKVLACFALPVYGLYCWSLGFEPAPFSGDYRVFFRNLTFILEFINPIRKSDFLPKALAKISDEAVLSSWTVAVDSIARLVNAYLIYQFVAAFRKHGKKSD